MSTLDELEYYCREENAFGALMLSGEWGCGKTHLIEHELAKALGDDFIIIRISLFGETSIESIIRKVHKEYLQKLMLNIGKTSLFSEKVNKAAEKVEDFTEKISKSNWGKAIHFASEMAKKIPGADKILALDLSECVTIEETIVDKKIILVFDDLERSLIDEVIVLGCINEFCENKHIKTIIVANEEKIKEKNVQINDGESTDNTSSENNLQNDKDHKIMYSEIKEKLVSRTIKIIPNYNNIFTEVISEYKTKNTDYKTFLKDNQEFLVSIFENGSINNIRSVKCAIQDFERVFNVLISKGIKEDLFKYFQAFVAFMLMMKADKIQRSDKYGDAFTDYEIEEKYPFYYNRLYMPSGLKDWIIEGEWNEQNINNDINEILKIQKNAEPKDIVKSMDLINIEEETIKEGLPEVLKMAYDGDLSIDEYINLLHNMLWARYISYNLPEKVDITKLENGVEKCLDYMCKTDTPDTRVRKFISESNMELMNDDEKRIYNKINAFRENEVQMFSINKRKYLNALRNKNIKELYECENKRFDIFDDELATEVFNYYKQLQNADRNAFMNLFYLTWRRTMIGDLQIESSIVGFQKLKNALSKEKQDEESLNYGIKASITKKFIENLDKIINGIKSIN